MIRFIVLVPLAWAIGVSAYLGGLYGIWSQTIGGDLDAVLFWSFLAFVITVPTVYVPILFGLRRWLRGYRPMIVYPIVAMLVGIIPTTIVVSVWGGGSRGLVSPEAGLFFIMFVVAGVVLGVGFAWPGRDAS